MYDHAQSPRLGQRLAPEFPGIQKFTGDEIPEVGYDGQLIYREDRQVIQVFNEQVGAWEDAIGGIQGQYTYVQATAPVAGNLNDLWWDTSVTPRVLKYWDGDSWEPIELGYVEPEQISDLVANYVTQYAISASETVAPTSGWSTTAPTRDPGTYIWYRVVVTRFDNSVSITDPALLTGNDGAQGEQGPQGPQGSQGIPGPPGEDGQTLYTWLKYADSPTTGMSDLPTGKTYMGIAYNKTSATESSNYNDYQWSLIQGPQGPQGNQGVQGPPGENGESLYTWIKYADDINGNGMSDSPVGKEYIGLAYNKTTATESTTPGDYQWALIQGPQGNQGIQGPPGDDGQSLFTWLKYADSPTTGMSDSPVGKTYMGLAYNKTSATESTNYGDYTWSLIQGPEGPQGDQGVQGPPGADGQPTYTWIKYAPNGAPSQAQMSDSPSGMTYIGLAHNKTTATESNNPSDYQWALIQGPQGPQGSQGIQGPPGVDGQSLYTWLKYADTPTTGMSDSPVGKKYIGLAYNKTSATESSTYSDYSWSLIEGPQGPQGNQGIQGPPGADGQPTYTWVKYAPNGAPTAGQITDTPVSGTTHIGFAFNKTTATESSTPGDYQWSLIQGPQGPAGAAAKMLTLTATAQVLTSPAAGGATNPATSVISVGEVNTSVTLVEYSVNGGAFSGTTPAGVALDFANKKVTITGSSMTARTIAIKVSDGAGTSDTLTVAKVFDGATGSTGGTGAAGADAITVVLTNEAHTFPGSTTAALAGSTVTQILAFKGATQIPVTINSITGSYTGLTATPANSGTTTAQVTVAVTTALTATSGELTFNLTIDGKAMTKKFSFAVARTGAQGTQGSTGVSVTAVTPYFAQLPRTDPAPTKPTTATPPDPPWKLVEPAFAPNTSLYRTEKITFSSGSPGYSYTNVTKVAAYEAALDALNLPTAAPSSSPSIAVTPTYTSFVVVTGDIAQSTVLDYYVNGVLHPNHAGTRKTTVQIDTLPNLVNGEPVGFTVGTEYTFHVVARNAKGSAAAGPTITSDLLVQGEELTAQDVLDKLNVALLEAGRIEVGDITIDADGGIVIPQSNSESRATVFPADGSQSKFGGDAEVDSLNVLGNLQIHGTDNELTKGSSLELTAGITAPRLAPVVSMSLKSYPTHEGFNGKGLAYHAARNCWYHTESVAAAVLVTLSSTYAFGWDSFDLNNAGGRTEVTSGMGGVAFHNATNTAYLLCQTTEAVPGTYNARWYVYQYRWDGFVSGVGSTWTFIRRWRYEPTVNHGGNSPYYPCIAVEGSYVYIGQCGKGGVPALWRYNLDGTGETSWLGKESNGTSNWNVSRHCHGLEVSSADVGGLRAWWRFEGILSVRVTQASGANHVRDEASDFTGASSSPRGIAFKTDGRFVERSGATAYEFSKQKDSISNVKVVNSWRKADGIAPDYASAETGPSPERTVTWTKRRFMTMETATSVPVDPGNLGDPNATTFYVSIPGVNSGAFMRAATPPATPSTSAGTATLDEAPVSGGLPGAVGNFPAGTSWVQADQSTGPTWKLEGSGRGRVGPWQWDDAGNVVAQPGPTIKRMVLTNQVFGTGTGGGGANGLAKWAHDMGRAPDGVIVGQIVSNRYVAWSSSNTDSTHIAFFARDITASNSPLYSGTLSFSFYAWWD